ncbi:hypothetical protein K1T71_013451 [Dendrolimus kikuchii]|uniref:Uncharacterized protein n=1 Tax=Dendrolimus kikuchii TaxID=765133 RepID=A0ACC1CGV4_9NEOP|nr:hypothetical protein K1T71_013451 [Dendrolimus kikuchii]
MCVRIVFFLNNCRIMSSANIKHTRKSSATEEKEKKRQSDSPAKEMMKKLAAKEKDKKDKETTKEKGTDKEEKNVDKQEKKQEKTVDKKEEKTKDDKVEKSGKTDKPEKRPDNKPKQNGNPTKPVHNGVSDVTLNANGGNDDSMNGTVSADSDDDAAMVIDDHDQDELFPELAYDETSDNECFEPPTPENAPSRSFTRRSQVKSTRTPETPRPTSDKQAADSQPAEDNPKDSKMLKLKDDTPASDRVLRSADSPKPESRKSQDAKKDKDDKDDDKKEDNKKEDEKVQEGDKQVIIDLCETNEEIKEMTDKTEQRVKEGGEVKETQEEATAVVVDITGEDKEKESSEDKWEKLEVQVGIEAEGPEEGSRKTDTNYSKSRVKVSPYRRSMRLAEQAETSAQANVSLMANYTGNNTTMEMDITETSFMSEEGNPDSSSYLRGLRNIRGRSSYKPLKEYTFKHTANRSTRSAASASKYLYFSRPTGTVVGRKRKPETDSGKDEPLERAHEAAEYTYATHKRMRILDRIAMPFRRTATLPSMGHTRRTAEIVGINTDLPLTAPVVSSETFDPETLKGAAAAPAPTPAPAHQEPVATPISTSTDRDAKKCVIV